MDVNNRTIRDYKNGIDCFGIKGEKTRDHIWPKHGQGKEGSTTQENIQYISWEANNIKDSNLSGEINGIRFAVEPFGEDDNGRIIGIMYIKRDGLWYEVV